MRIFVKHNSSNHKHYYQNLYLPILAIFLSILLLLSLNSLADTNNPRKINQVLSENYQNFEGSNDDLDDEAVTKQAKELKGYQVKFNYQNYSKEREIAYQHFLNRFPEIKQKNYSFERNEIGIDLFDINNDGNKEIFAYLENSPYCSNAGCPFEILKVIEPGQAVPLNWSDPKKIENNSLNVHENIIVLKSQNLGVHDLLFSSKSVWRWQGDYYMRVKNAN